MNSCTPSQAVGCGLYAIWMLYVDKVVNYHHRHVMLMRTFCFHSPPWDGSPHGHTFRTMDLLYIIFTTLRRLYSSGSWASCQISKIAGAHAPGMPGTFPPPPQVSDSDMHHGTCVTHVPWCMPGSLTRGFLWIRRRGKSFPAFPAHAQPSILRIWQEDHG